MLIFSQGDIVMGDGYSWWGPNLTKYVEDGDVPEDRVSIAVHCRKEDLFCVLGMIAKSKLNHCIMHQDTEILLLDAYHWIVYIDLLKCPTLQIKLFP